MLRIILMLVTLALMACNSTESDGDPSIGVGTYQYKVTGPDGYGIIQFQFKADGTYAGKAYITLNDGSMDCMVSEGSGKYSLSAGHLKMTEKKSRARTECADPLGAWSDRPDSNEEIRGVTATSFELYSAADDESPATWIKFTKL